MSRRTLTELTCEGCGHIEIVDSTQAAGEDGWSTGHVKVFASDSYRWLKEICPKCSNRIAQIVNAGGES